MSLPSALAGTLGEAIANGADMDELARFSGLIEAIYDAAMGNESFWPLGQRIAAAFNCESCSISALNAVRGPVEALTLTENCVAGLPNYVEYYHKNDPWAALGQSRLNGMMLSQEHIPDTEFRRTAFYQDHCRPSGTAYVLGAVVSLDQAAGSIGVIGIHRAETEAQFGEADKRLGELILPHLKRAMQMRERLAMAGLRQHAMDSATDTLGVGVIAAAQDMRILSINPVAEALLRRGNGLCVQNHRLTAIQPFHDNELRRLVYDAAKTSRGRSLQAGGYMRISRQAGRPLGLSVYPFSAPERADGSPVPAALIFIADPDAATTPAKDTLARIYALSNAEARLFEALLTGERLQDYAHRLRISTETAKSQLARIFHKTGHARQADLIRDALSNPILRGRHR